MLAPALLLWIFASQFDAPPTTQTVLDRHRQIIGSVNPAHQGYEFWTPLSQIPPPIIQATLEKEDRYFRWHPGMNPLSTLNALAANIKSGGVVRGGSTLTQQLAKMLLQDAANAYRPRTLGNKIKETLLALGLELKHSKDWILERYLNGVYYGNRCYGVTAAARYYFNKNLLALNSQEISLLTRIAQNPSRARGLIPNPLGQKRSALARHFIEWAAKQNPGSTVIHSTLDLDIQRHLEDSVLKLLEDKTKEDPLLNAGLVVIDVPSGELRAMVGSRDYFDETIDGAYNAALALRQPGSALKPFTYFLAFSKGYTPESLVRDEPHSFTSVGDTAPYVPQNFDLKYHGEVSFRSALANSYNVPAVLLLNELGIGNYLDLLHRFGLTSLNRSPKHYGLSLTLGSGEVTLLDLTNAYAALARGGAFQPVTSVAGTEKIQAKEILPRASEYAAHVTDVLSDAKARVPAFGFNEDLLVEGAHTAVKTGTSYNHNDNWAVGYNDSFAVGVWLGHSDNTPLKESTGASGAGPLWHAAMEPLARQSNTTAKALPARKPRQPVLPSQVISPDLLGRGDWHIIAPLANNRYRLKPYLPYEHQQILARISSPAPIKAQWILDGQELGSSEDNQFWITPKEGDHVLEVISTTGRKKVHFRVEEDS